MGYYLRRFAGADVDNLTREELVEVAEQALRLQLELAHDALAVADRVRLRRDRRETDQRIQRARQTVRTLDR